MLRERLWQFGFVVLAALAAGAGALLQPPLRLQRQALELDTLTADPGVAKDPRTVLLQLAPGGLRAPFVNYLWIRSQELKQDEKFFDAKQQRDLICDLMPHFAGVWAFHAWDMAWNISVATHTPQERWMWVHNGIVLLRDKGLYYNPKELILYKELGWIFYSKMGQYTDDMHMVYKRRWAGKMHQVLGGPPMGASTSQVIAAFRPVAEATDDPSALAGDKQAGGFLAALAQLGVAPDEGFLEFYNRFADDALVGSMARLTRPPDDPRLRGIRDLMRSDAQASGRAKVLAFVRRKVLKSTYKMDPAWMLKVMEKYGPLDWRSVYAHALYWATLGLHRVEGLDLNQMHALNTDRITLDSLQSLTRTGQLYYTPNPDDPEDPDLRWGPDWRFIEPTHQEYITSGALLVEDPAGKMSDLDKVASEQNALRDAHINFLANAIEQMYTGDREDLAQHYYDELKRVLKPTGEVYELSLYDFVRFKLRQGGVPPAEMARAFWDSGLSSAYRALLGGDADGYVHYMAFARRAYETFRQTSGLSDRLRPSDFDDQERDYLVNMLLQPEALGMRLPLLVKVRLYNALPPRKQAEVYPMVAEAMRQECSAEQIDFDKAFPAPVGYQPPAAPVPSGP